MFKDRIKTNLKKYYHRVNRITCPVKIENVTLEPRCRGFGYKMGTPIDRYYIENFLKDNQKIICGDVLEVSEDVYSKKFGTDCNGYILSYDASVSGKNIIVGDLIKPESLPEDRFDCFICTQTLNFIFEINEAVKSIFRILKPGGVALVTVASVSQISKYDKDRWGDYWRFTEKSLLKLFMAEFPKENLEIFNYGNYFAAISLFSGIVVEDLPDKSILDVEDDEFPVVICLKVRKD